MSGALPEPGARIFCVGRNYREHAREMGAPETGRPVLFLKPASACCAPGPARLPTGHGRVDFEGELVFELSGDPRDPVRGAALGVDLTLRDLQGELKQQGLPWDSAKGFDGSALLGPRVPVPTDETAALEFRLWVNDQLRQQGRAQEMRRPPRDLVAAIAAYWEPRAGDLLFSGTPAGVGPLQPGDEISMDSPQLGSAAWQLQA